MTMVYANAIKTIADVWLLHGKQPTDITNPTLKIIKGIAASTSDLLHPDHPSVGANGLI